MVTTKPARRDPARDLSAPRHQALAACSAAVGRRTSVEGAGRVACKRSIKREAKLWALDLTIRMMDLTTLEGKDTPGKIRALAGKARRPDPTDPSIPSVAALCVYPAMVPEARAALEGSGVKVAAVATYFPSGQAPQEVKLADVRAAKRLGADEIDMVIDRGAFLAGEYARVFDDIVAVKEACGETHLKVILRPASSTSHNAPPRSSPWRPAPPHQDLNRQGVPASTLPVTLVMLEAIRDFTSRLVAGGEARRRIRTAKEAIGYLTVLYETLGPDWMTPDRFRFGASSLLNDVLMQIRKERSGRYSGGDYFTLD
jgi:deoxyribose-phosphate aldolase